MISKKINWGFDAVAPNGVPDGAGDRYYSQDLLRDFLYMMDRMGLVYKDLMNQIPFFVSGGVVTQGAGTTFDITAGVGYVKKSVQTVLSYAASPPTTQDEDIEATRVAWTAQNDLVIAGWTAGGAVNYLKVAYTDLDGTTRSRAKKAGSWAYDSSPSFTFTATTVAPTDYELCIATFTEAGGTFTFGSYAAHLAGYINIDTINERTSAAGITVDGSTIKDGTITDDGSAGIGVETVDGSILRTKIIEIGDWNMDSTANVSISHGIANFKKIRGVHVIVRRDADDVYYKFEQKNAAGGNEGGYVTGITSTHINLDRLTGGGYDNNTFDSTSFNRGWITILYVD